MKNILEIIEGNRQGQACGVYSVCCAQPLVIEAALQQAAEDGSIVVIEATANQVNQFGGYTGMLPKDFVAFVESLAAKHVFPMERVLLGGDHLGPVCWTDENADNAMAKAKDLIKAYVEAGFKKIHLDTSMPCGGDGELLSDEIVAERASQLCAVAEQAAVETFGKADIVYIVGTEVPPPGGATEEIEELEVTPVARVQQTYDFHKRAFLSLGLADAWQRVVGLVVQPGVEFDHTSIIDYQADKAQALSQFVQTVPNLVFEAHSTDYQLPSAYQELVRDHFAILKVGPQLTFAMREAIFALSHIEDALFTSAECSNIRDVFEQVMLDNPNNWQKFYAVSADKQQFYRRYSYSDRIRYYWNQPQVETALTQLINNLESIQLPLPLISQYLPEQYQAIRTGELKNAPKALIIDKINQVTRVYAKACYSQEQA